MPSQINGKEKGLVTESASSEFQRKLSRKVDFRELLGQDVFLASVSFGGFLFLLSSSLAVFWGEKKWERKLAKFGSIPEEINM